MKRSKASSVIQTNSVLNDSNQGMASKYIKDFSELSLRYKNDKTDESLALINRMTSLLTSTIQPHHFNTTSLDTSKFFRELHSLIGTLSSDNDVLWSCIGLLLHCCKNFQVKRALVDGYRFVPLLTSVLKDAQLNKEKTKRLLNLLQELTYGIRITWEEPFVSVLLDQCIGILYQSIKDGEDELGMLALSILINVCYKNFQVLLLFMRIINISEFSAKIKVYGTLASKMLIVLSEDVDVPEEEALHTFIRSSFVTISDCLKENNISYLKHTVDFLLDSENSRQLHRAMLSYANYCEDIERLLEQLETSDSMDNSSDELKTQHQVCMGLFFQLVLYILELSSIEREENKENIISLDSNIPRIYQFVCNYLESDTCGVNAVLLLNGLIKFAKGEVIAARIAKDSSALSLLVNISETSGTNPKYSASVLRLLLSLLQLTKTEKLILSRISESYFDKILQPLLALNVYHLRSPNILPVQEIEKCVFCLLLMVNFASIAKKAYFEKCCSVLQLPQVHYALANATLSGDEATCCAIFQISQFEHFPQVQVAKFLSQFRATKMENVRPSINQVPGDLQKRDLSEMLRIQNVLTNKSSEERLNALIDTISYAHKQNQLSGVPTTKIIELYNHKIQKYDCMISNMESRLQDASQEIDVLRQSNTLQNAELEKYHGLNFELYTQLEDLQTQCKELKKERDNFKENLAEFTKKVSQQAQSLQISEKRLSVKVSEMISLQREHESITEQLSTKSDQLEKQLAINKENASRIEKLKKSITAYESDVKEKAKIIEERDRELAKLGNSLESQKEAKKKSDDIITALEAQLQEKNEEIRNYEREINDTEELRKTIMSLMESKKPKRKT